MDFNFADLKKEAAATAEDIFGQAADVAKKTTASASNISQNLLSGGSAVEPHDANLHTAEVKELDFEHVDPQTFVQRMSAGAKEAQEELDAKFAQKTQDFDDFLGNAALGIDSFAGQMTKGAQDIGGMTHNFMNMERGYFDGADIKGDILKPAVAPAAANKNIIPEADLLNSSEFAPSAPSAPLAPMGDYYVNDPITITASKTVTVNKDSDTDSPSISYNPSPAKKNPIADALKEQENEKFISSEDLLSDFKEERTATPDFHAVNVAAAGANANKTATGMANIPTTDLDDDDNDDDDIDLDMDNDADDDSMQSYIPKPEISKQMQAETRTADTFVPVAKPKIEPTTTPAPAPAATAKPVAVSEPMKPQPNVAAAKDKPTYSAQDTKVQQPKIISVEEIFYKYGLDAWFKPERLHPQVESLIYWRDVKKSGIVFGAGLIILLAISCFSVISVFAYLSILLLAGTIAFRMYKSVMQAIQKTQEGHPFQEYLDIDLTLSPARTQYIFDFAVAHLNGFVAELRRLFLVEDLVDSIKFGVILWVMTYIGAWFNGMTLVILAFVTLFTLPKVYENNKNSIDTYLDLVRNKLTEITNKIKMDIPIINNKPVAAETDKDK